jgi:hypothetical protein
MCSHRSSQCHDIGWCQRYRVRSHFQSVAQLTQGPFRATTSVYNAYLNLGRFSTFALITEYQQFASAVAFSTPRPPRIVWSHDRSKLAIDDQTVELHALRMGMKKMLQDTEQLMKFLCGRVLETLRVPMEITDRMMETAIGYSWMDNGPYTSETLPLLKELVECQSWRICAVHDNDKIIWNMASIARFFDTSGQITEFLAVLNHVLCSLPNRATEFVDMRIRNSIRERNLYFVMDQMYWFTLYTKNSNVQEHDSCIPAIVPDALRTLNMQYLLLVRPVEELLSRIAYDYQSVQNYHYYMYVCQGKRMAASDFSRLLGSKLKQYTGAHLTVNPYRHVAVALQREFIPPEHTAMGNRWADLCLGHSTTTARGHYAHEEDSAYISADAMWEFERVNFQWHDILGVGRRNPPPSIRLQHAGIRDDPSLEAIVKGLTDTMKAELAAQLQAQNAQFTRQIEDTLKEFRATLEHSASTGEHQIPNAEASGVRFAMPSPSPPIIPPTSQSSTTPCQTADVLGELRYGTYQPPDLCGSTSSLSSSEYVNHTYRLMSMLNYVYLGCNIPTMMDCTKCFPGKSSRAISCTVLTDSSSRSISSSSHKYSRYIIQLHPVASFRIKRVTISSVLTIPTMHHTLVMDSIRVLGITTCLSVQVPRIPQTSHTPSVAVKSVIWRYRGWHAFMVRLLASNRSINKGWSRWHWNAVNTSSWFCPLEEERVCRG